MSQPNNKNAAPTLPEYTALPWPPLEMVVSRYVRTPPTEPESEPIPTEPSDALDVTVVYVLMNVCTQMLCTTAVAPFVVMVTYTEVADVLVLVVVSAVVSVVVSAFLKSSNADATARSARNCTHKKNFMARWVEWVFSAHVGTNRASLLCRHSTFLQICTCQAH